MKIFEFIPKKNTNKLTAMVGLLLMGSAVMFLIAMIYEEMPYLWAIQLLGIGMLAMMIFVVSRYLMKNFAYAVTETEEGSDFTVTELQGKRSVTVCRIAMSSVEQVIVVEQNDRQADTTLKNMIKSQKRKMFNYCADLFTDKYICVLSNESGTPIAIKLTYDESLEKLFGAGELPQNQEDA